MKQTDQNSFFFAGGGTGGHLYPAIAVAQCIQKLQSDSIIHFFCSNRSIDSYILSQTGFQTTILPARAFPSKPGEIIKFFSSFNRSYNLAKQVITQSKNSVVIGLGGFISGPVCWAAHRNNIPLAFINVDILPGKANKIIARWADEIFVQFADTAKCFEKYKAKISVTGCPLRSGFTNPVPNSAIEQLGLDRTKKILLITGASSGSESINNAISSLLDRFDSFVDTWQIVHLTGRNNFEKIPQRYESVRISHKVLGYYDDMPNLLAAADLIIGRSGAVSVAEFSAAAVPCILIPYPHHKDRHQYLNAQQLVRAGSAVVVEDLPDKKEMSERLWKELEKLMSDDALRERMKTACRSVSQPEADVKIAQILIDIKST